MLKPERRPTRADKLADIIRELSTKKVLRSPAELSETVAMPPELFVAMASGRPEMIKLAKPRTLSEEETKQVFHLIATLIETNMLLKEHAEAVSKLVGDWANLFKGLHKLGDEIENFAGFKTASDIDERNDA